MRVKIEPANLRNLDELFEIERECFTIEAFTKNEIASLLRKPNAITLLARVNGEIAGFIIGLIENYAVKVGRIYTIDVAVKHRRRRIGMKLLKEMERTFLTRGIQTCYLEVRVDNQAARRLYQLQGYVEIEPLGDYYSKGINGLRLKKQLKPKPLTSS